MMRSFRLRRPGALCVIAAVCTALHAGKALAQEPAEPPTPRAFCREGRPANECRMFLLVEGRFFHVLAGSRYPFRVAPEFLRPDTVERHMELSGYVAYEAGVLVNTDPDRAIGATFLLGGDESGRRVAVKGRYRRWIGRTAAWDLGVGVLSSARRVPAGGGEPGHGYVPAVGLIGDVSVGLTDGVGIGVQGDLLFSSGRDPATALSAGAQLGGKPTRIVTAAARAYVAAVLVVTGIGGGGTETAGAAPQAARSEPSASAARGQVSAASR